MHILFKHNLYFIQPHVHRRPLTSKHHRSHLPEKLKLYAKRRVAKVEYQMRIRVREQRQPVVDQVCLAYGVIVYEDLPKEGRKEVRENMWEYKSKEN